MASFRKGEGAKILRKGRTLLREKKKLEKREKEKGDGEETKLKNSPFLRRRKDLLNSKDSNHHKPPLRA